MFIGHYAVSFALKSVEKRASLVMLFLAVQFVDILFFLFTFLGIEHFRIVERYTASTHFELVHMPYTHSLLSSVLWALVVFVTYNLFQTVRGRETLSTGNRSGVFIGIAVLSHWFLDLLVHTPDLQIIGNLETKVGFGLWNYPVVTFVLEGVLLLGGVWMYMRSTKANSTLGQYGIPAFAAILILINVYNIFGPVGSTDTVSAAAMALTSYFAFAGIAFWLDAKRRPI